MHPFLGPNRQKKHCQEYQQQQQHQQQQQQSLPANNSMNSSSPQHPVLTSEAVAALPPPGLSGPSSLTFSPLNRGESTDNDDLFLAFVATSSMLTAQHPQRLEFNNPFPSSQLSSAAITANNKRAGASSSSSSSSSSERQIFVLNVSNILSQHKQKRSLSSSTTCKLSGPPQPHEPLPTYESSLSKLPVYPLLRIPTNRSKTDTAATSTISVPSSKNRFKTQEFPKPSSKTSGVANTSILSAAFTSRNKSEATTRSTPQLQSTANATATTFPNISSTSLIQFSWCCSTSPSSSVRDPVFLPAKTNNVLRLLVPIRGSLYVQHGILEEAQPLSLVYDRSRHKPPSPWRSNKTNNASNQNNTDAEDSQLSPDGRMVAFVVAGELFVAPCDRHYGSSNNCCVVTGELECVQVTFGATDVISHGVADFIAQEEMDRYRGFWWHPDSNGILFTKLDESPVPNYRILHQDVGNGVGPPANNHLGAMMSSSVEGGDGFHPNGNSGITSHSSSNVATYEDHRYPFAGSANPSVSLGFVEVNYETYFGGSNTSFEEERRDAAEEKSADQQAREEWDRVRWYESPREAPEYLARVQWLPDGSACAQWQNRNQNTLVMTRMNVRKAEPARPLLIERSQYWINLHHMLRPLPYAIHPDICDGTVDNIPSLPNPLPEGSFSFLFASERTGYCHLYLYTYAPGCVGDQAILLKSISGDGNWMVENIVGIDMKRDTVYVMGTFDSVLERHLYALPLTKERCYHCSGVGSGDHYSNEDITGNMNLTNSKDMSTASKPDYVNHNHNHGVRHGLKQVMNVLSGKNRSRSNSGTATADLHSSTAGTVHPLRLTVDSGMHSVVMDEKCQAFVDTSSDLDRPTTVQLFALDHGDEDGNNNRDSSIRTANTGTVKSTYIVTIYDALHDEKTMTALSLTTATNARNSNNQSHNGIPGKTHRLLSSLPAPELLSFPTSDGSETLHAALYRPDPAKHGPGPYPLVCAVYGGPHVQRVNRSWSQCADMRAQRLCSLGFCVVKCDNRGSSRRGMAFESAIARRLGRLEVLDQVATVRHLTLRGIVDPSRVGIYGWSYGGYLSAMCLCRAPDVFHVAVAGAPVTSWDGYDTHYTERYMGLPSENVSGYRESAVFDHVPNIRGRLMLVHGLIDENVHFRHTARLINRLISAGKDYDLLIFPDERHSPRRLRDRIYMEQRISDYFVRHLGGNSSGGGSGGPVGASGNTSVAVRSVPGHL